MAFERHDREFSATERAGRSYFRQVSTRKRPQANLAFDLAPLAGSGLYLSAIHTIRTSRTTQPARPSLNDQLDPIAVPGRIRFTA
jgi:hypothetical protein